MFQAIINRAQSAINDAVASAATRALMAVPFLLAAGFGVAALYLRLAREYGAETATMLMAALWTAVGLVVAAILASRRNDDDTSGASDAAYEDKRSETAASGDTAQPTTGPTLAFSGAEKDLLLAALTSAAPIAMPQLARLLLRNLPLIAVIIAAYFVLTRAPSPTADEVAERMSAAPAE